MVVVAGMAQDHAHLAGVDARGDKVMGFAHDKTTHHFLLKDDGGVIQVTANAATDKESIGQIQMHLRHIAKKFAAGDFAAPMLIHGAKPPGVDVLVAKKNLVDYKFEELPAGAAVRITTKEKAVLAAIHEFLKFQIVDHRTGDPLQMKP